MEIGSGDADGTNVAFLLVLTRCAPINLPHKHPRTRDAHQGSTEALAPLITTSAKEGNPVRLGKLGDSVRGDGVHGMIRHYYAMLNCTGNAYK